MDDELVLMEDVEKWKSKRRQRTKRNTDLSTEDDNLVSSANQPSDLKSESSGLDQFRYSGGSTVSKNDNSRATSAKTTRVDDILSGSTRPGSRKHTSGDSESIPSTLEDSKSSKFAHLTEKYDQIEESTKTSRAYKLVNTSPGELKSSTIDFISETSKLKKPPTDHVSSFENIKLTPVQRPPEDASHMDEMSDSRLGINAYVAESSKLDEGIKTQQSEESDKEEPTKKNKVTSAVESTKKERDEQRPSKIEEVEDVSQKPSTQKEMTSGTTSPHQQMPKKQKSVIGSQVKKKTINIMATGVSKNFGFELKSSNDNIATVIVDNVQQESPTERAGLKNGDFVIEVNDREVQMKPLADVEKLVNDCARMRHIKLVVLSPVDNHLDAFVELEEFVETIQIPTTGQQEFIATKPSLGPASMNNKLKEEGTDDDSSRDDSKSTVSLTQKTKHKPNSESVTVCDRKQSPTIPCHTKPGAFKAKGQTDVEPIDDSFKSSSPKPWKKTDTSTSKSEMFEKAACPSEKSTMPAWAQPRKTLDKNEEDDRSSNDASESWKSPNVEDTVKSKFGLVSFKSAIKTPPAIEKNAIGNDQPKGTNQCDNVQSEAFPLSSTTSEQATVHPQVDLDYSPKAKHDEVNELRKKFKVSNLRSAFERNDKSSGESVYTRQFEGRHPSGDSDQQSKPTEMLASGNTSKRFERQKHGDNAESYERQPISDNAEIFEREQPGDNNMRFASQPSIDSSKRFESPPSIDSSKRIESPQSIDSSKRFESPQSIDSSKRFERHRYIDSSKRFESPPSIDSSKRFESPQSIDSSKRFESPQSIDSSKRFESPPSIDSSKRIESPQSIDSSKRFESPQSIDSSKRYERHRSIDSSKRIESQPSGEERSTKYFEKTGMPAGDVVPMRQFEKFQKPSGETAATKPLAGNIPLPDETVPWRPIMTTTTTRYDNKNNNNNDNRRTTKVSLPAGNYVNSTPEADIRGVGGRKICAGGEPWKMTPARTLPSNDWMSAAEITGVNRDRPAADADYSTMQPMRNENPITEHSWPSGYSSNGEHKITMSTKSNSTDVTRVTIKQQAGPEGPDVNRNVRHTVISHQGQNAADHSKFHGLESYSSHAANEANKTSYTPTNGNHHNIVNRFLINVKNLDDREVSKITSNVSDNQKYHHHDNHYSNSSSTVENIGNVSPEMNSPSSLESPGTNVAQCHQHQQRNVHIDYGNQYHPPKAWTPQQQEHDHYDIPVIKHVVDKSSERYHTDYNRNESQFDNQHVDSSCSLRSPTAKPQVNSQEPCTACRQPLGKGTAVRIDSLNIFFHMDCFRCSSCRRPVEIHGDGTDVNVEANNRVCCQACAMHNWSHRLH